MAIVETDWAELQQAWIKWVEDTTGRCAVWRDDRQYAMGPEPYFLLHLQNIAYTGLPSTTYQYDSVRDVVVPRQSQMVSLLLEISCISNDQCPGFLAQQELARLKIRSRHPVYYSVLEDVCLSLNDYRDIASVPFEHQGRELSQATAEFTFSYQDVYQDSSLTDSYIANVNDTDNCVDLDGVQVSITIGGLLTESGDNLVAESGDVLLPA